MEIFSALLFSLICAYINGWVNNCIHYDATVMAAQLEICLYIYGARGFHGLIFDTQMSCPDWGNKICYQRSSLNNILYVIRVKAAETSFSIHNKHRPTSNLFPSTSIFSVAPLSRYNTVVQIGYAARQVSVRQKRSCICHERSVWLNEISCDLRCSGKQFKTFTPDRCLVDHVKYPMSKIKI